MKEGAYVGAIVAFFVYFMLPIYGNDGMPAKILPTGNVVSDTGSFNSYVGNLPFSMLIFFALEVVGISTGIAGQMMLKSVYSN